MLDFTKTRNLLVATLLLAPSLAAANSGGITGSSGQNGNFCNGCHRGGAAPMVTLTGPAMLDAGKMGTYTLTITGGAAVVGGFNVSSDNRGTQFVAGAGSQVRGGEVTHMGAKRFANNTVSWDFTLVAPMAGGTVNLFGAGNSTNNSGNTAGDLAATTKLAVQVVGGATPDMAMEPADMAMAPAVDMPMAPGADMAIAAAADMAARAGDMSVNPPMMGGCSTTGGAGSGLAALLALVPVALLFGRRRRSRE